MSADPAGPDSPVTSPCVGICCLDQEGICIGCFRSGVELAEWPCASDAARRDILARCQARRIAQDQRRQPPFPRDGGYG